MTLKEVRTQFQISQQQAANIIGIPHRTYFRYESDESYGDALKREMMINKIIDHCEVTEDKGLLTIESISKLVSEVLESKYKDTVEFCYLFGSYAKGYATEKSDIDLCISTSLTGLKFVGISEDLRAVLHKKIDLLRLNNLKDNVELINEIMKEGIKIYG